ncbi:jg23963 [Pararge aegeria aegeria]|uniref:Jg23963 protein n=1 Tax=Pararge aegeria aegeria TaxID=348720 RepID=A0A8S4RIK5_9NEOP|nr:jg23963 [Pararge aegeria aegeria]
MARGLIAMSLHGLVITGAVALALWASGVAAGAARYDTATPHTPPAAKYKYIPLHDNGLEEIPDGDETEDDTTSSGMPTSELILTLFRTALDVVRKINKNRATSALPTTASNNTAIQLHRKTAGNGTSGSGRGFEDYYDEHHYHETTTTEKPLKQGRYTDPWAGYYDWIINEGSFKFWSVFQLFTAAVLLYACLSAIYYAKFNPIIPDYSLEYDDYFLERNSGRKARSIDPSNTLSGLSWINPITFQFILDAISNHYENQ